MCIFVCGLPMFIVALVLASLLALKPYPVYVVTPSNCRDDALTAADAPEWRTGPYYVLFDDGACPVLSRTQTWFMQRVRQGKYSHRYYNVSSWKYLNCLNNATQWAALDARNAASGYTGPSFVAGYERWATASSYTHVSGRICSALFIGAVIVLLLSSCVDINDCCVSVTTQFWLFFTVVVGIGGLVTYMWLAVPILVSTTAQATPSAWTASYFKSCDVSIHHDQGLSFAIVVGVFSFFIVVFIVLAMFHGSFGPGEGAATVPGYEPVPDGVKNNGGPYAEAEGTEKTPLATAVVADNSIPTMTPIER